MTCLDCDFIIEPKYCWMKEKHVTDENICPDFEEKGWLEEYEREIGEWIERHIRCKKRLSNEEVRT